MTTQDVKVSRPSIWRDTFKLVQTSYKAMVIIGLCLFLVLAVMNVTSGLLQHAAIGAVTGTNTSTDTPISTDDVTSYNESAEEDTQGAIPSPDMAEDIAADEQDVGEGLQPGVAILGMITMIISFVIYYFLLHAYLVASRAQNVPARSVGGFFRYLGITIAVGFLMIIPAILAGGLFGVIASQAKGSEPGFVLTVIVGGISILLLVAAIIVAFRLMLAGVMVVHGKKGVLAGSWHITKGKFWRIVGNGLMVILPLLVIYCIVKLPLFYMATMNGSMILVVVSGFWDAIYGVAASGLGAGFIVTAYRILHQEYSLSVKK